MKDFIERWNSDKRYQTKVKLSLYTLFVVIVSIFAISSRNTISTNEIEDNNINNMDNEVENENNSISIEIPETYNYTISITINENIYTYTGNKTTNQETITKEVDEVVNNYIYQNNDYYKEDNENYILTTEDEIYDIIDRNYIDLETINQYLSKSSKEGNQSIVYLKDIILGNDSEEYIIIELNDNKINIDYTSLMKEFDKSITKYLVKIEIE